MSLENSYSPWSDLQETYLRHYYRWGKSVEWIASIMGRSPEGIRDKLRRLQIYVRQEDKEKMKRYLTFYIEHNGNMRTILSRRGYTPDDIVRQTLEKTADYRRKEHGRYLLEIGDEGTYGQSMNCKLFKILLKPPVHPYTLEKVY